jgi:hypothetical protein
MSIVGLPPLPIADSERLTAVQSPLDGACRSSSSGFLFSPGARHCRSAAGVARGIHVDTHCQRTRAHRARSAETGRDCPGRQATAAHRVVIMEDVGGSGPPPDARPAARLDRDARIRLDVGSGDMRDKAFRRHPDTIEAWSFGASGSLPGVLWACPSRGICRPGRAAARGWQRSTGLPSLAHMAGSGAGSHVQIREVVGGAAPPFHDEKCGVVGGHTTSRLGQ